MKRICLKCGTEYEGRDDSTLCPKCAAEHQKRQHAKWESEHREERRDYHNHQYKAKISAMTPEEYAEYQEKTNVRAR